MTARCQECKRKFSYQEEDIQQLYYGRAMHYRVSCPNCGKSTEVKPVKKAEEPEK